MRTDLPARADFFIDGTSRLGLDLFDVVAPATEEVLTRLFGSTMLTLTRP